MAKSGGGYPDLLLKDSGKVFYVGKSANQGGFVNGIVMAGEQIHGVIQSQLQDVLIWRAAICFFEYFPEIILRQQADLTKLCKANFR